MRKTFIVTYDIRDDKRLRKVFKTMRNWGDHLQLSVFECQLNPTEIVELKTALNAIIHHELDQILFIDLGPSEGRGDRVIEAMGQPYSEVDAACVII